MNLNEIKKYIPCKLHKGKCWYVSYYAFNPESEKLQRKRIKINRIINKAERKKYANSLMIRFNTKLEQGWNPFIDPEASKSYNKLSDAKEHFFKINLKKFNEGIIREDTYKDYVSYLRNFQNWLNDNNYGDIYVYKFDRIIIDNFLEYIYVERDRTATTRNNYLNFLSVFSGFLVEKNYLKSRPTDGLKKIRKTKVKKTIIDKKTLENIFKHTKRFDPNYHLACNFLYYTFIRPKEMTFIKIGDISYKNRTIYLSAENTKNKRDAIVTIPKPLMKIFLDMKIHEYASEDFLFSNNKLRPGKMKLNSKVFRDKWLQMRKLLKFSDKLKFYTLKDTGITELLTLTKDLRIVRDQARHSNMAITDIYTPRGNMQASEIIKNLDY